MVTINAGLLMGPDLTISNPYLKGAAEMYEDGVFVTVDLDFLVDAHICVYEEIATYGRYLCFNHIINQQQDAFQLANMLSPLPSPPQRYMPHLIMLSHKFYVYIFAVLLFQFFHIYIHYITFFIFFVCI